MRATTSHFRLLILSTVYGILLLLAAKGNPALADEGGQHPNEVMSEHMQAMLAIKKTTPEEYRIMQRTPIYPNEESLQQGRKLFLHNCSVCHGEKGDGKGPAAATLKTQPANFLDKKHSDIYAPGEKFWIIGNGSGKTDMPGFPQIDPLDRWHLVNFILHLRQQGTKEKKGHDDH